MSKDEGKIPQPYWAGHLNLYVINLRRLKEKIDNFINFLLYFIGIIGILSFGFWVYLNWFAIKADFSLIFNFYQSQHWTILIFLLSLIFDLFLIYRVSEKRAKRKKIKYKKVPEKIEVSKTLNKNAQEALEDAFLLARKFKQPEVTPIHLFWAMLSDKQIKSVFIRLNIDGKKLIDKLRKYLKTEEKTSKTRLSSETKELLVAAFLDAYKLKQKNVQLLNLLLFCAHNSKTLEEILYEFEITKQKIINVVEWFRVEDMIKENRREYRKLAQFKPDSNMNKSYTAIATPILDRYSYDLTVKAKYGKTEICVTREKELEEIFQALNSGQNGILLTGEVGVGKRTTIEGLAQLMVKEEVPKLLQDKRLVELDISRLLSGASPAQAEERLLEAIYEINHSGNIILYIENLENLVGITAGQEESLELAEVLAEAISRKSLICLASATRRNYSNYLENGALGQTMTTVAIKEPETNQAIQILESKVSTLESRYGVYFTYNAIESAVKMSDKYMSNKFLPDKAIKIIESAAVKTLKEGASKENYICNKNIVSKILSKKTGIPLSKITEDESEKLLNLEDHIHGRMINQEEAVKAVSNSLRRARANLREGNRPIASFLFLGPTGVGKTELAKSVSQIYFGDEEYMIRLDMSEYQHPDSVKKMIGDNQGNPGYLTEAVRKKPFSLILLDEIEKAHPDILNLFLQLMDDGRLTDAEGRTISFSNSIIICTSNAGALYIQEQVKKKTDLSVIKETLVEEELNKVMRPELINRFDGIIVFKPLTENNIFEITKLLLKKFAKTLKPKGIGLKTTDQGVKVLAHRGYDPKFGARPIRRLLQDEIENDIASKLIAKELKRRDKVVINEEGKVEVEKAKEL